MRSSYLAAAAAMLLGSTGCIVVSGGGGGGGTVQRGDLTVFYLFNGAECGPAGVTDIVINITGVSTTDSDVKNVTCASSPQGLTVRDFVAGTYDVTVTGYAGSAVLYAMDAPTRVTVVAGADNEYELRATSRTGDLSVYWADFAGAGTCAQAGVSQVRVMLYNAYEELADDQTFNCSAGGVSWDFLAPGAYSIYLDALSANGRVLYQADVAANVVSGRANDYTSSFVLVSGDLTVWWTFGGSAVCGAVSKVRVVAIDPWGYDFDDTLYDCADAGVAYDAIRAGTWTVFLQGLDSYGNVFYQSNEANLEVAAGMSRDYTVDLYGL